MTTMDKETSRCVLFLQLGVFFASLTTTVALYIMADYYMDPGTSGAFGGICNKRIEDASFYLSSHLDPFGTWSYKSNVECLVTMDAGTMNGARFKVDWQWFQLEGDCNKDYVEVYHVDLVDVPTSTAIGKFCGTNTIAVGNPGRYLTLKFVTDGSNELDGFKLRGTRWEPPPCQDDEFLCASENICIDSRLKCDGTQHCHDLTDEEGCSGWDKFIGNIISMGMGGMVGLGIGVLSGCVGIAVLIGAFTCCKNCCIKCCCWWPCCKGKFDNSSKVAPEKEEDDIELGPTVIHINDDGINNHEYDDGEGDEDDDYGDSRNTKVANHNANYDNGLADVY